MISLLSGNNIDVKRLPQIKSTKIFSFDIESHKFLENMNYDHFLADELLNDKEREEIFEHSISKLYWYENSALTNDLLLNGKSILEMVDPLQLHQKLIVSLVQFSIIKKILQTEEPMKIYTTQNLSRVIKCLNNNVEITLLNSEDIEIFKNFDLRIRIFSKNVKIKISMKKLEKIQAICESFIGNFFNFWFNTKQNKPVILLLEFDPSKFEKLLLSLKTAKSDTVILNRRKSAISNLRSIQIMKKSNSKIINFNRFLSNEEKKDIINMQEKYKKDLNNLWNANQLFEKIFSYNGHSYWMCIKDFLINQYENNVFDYIKYVIEANAIFQKLNIKCVLYQYESGNSENATLSRHTDTPSLLLRHGFAAYTKKTAKLRWKYDSFRLVKLNCDQIIFWGNADYEYYSNHLSDSQKHKAIGSPRHDEFFCDEKLVNKKTKMILITTPPIIEWSGFLDTHTALRYENTLRQLIESIKKLDNVKIIGKLHPGWGWKFNYVLLEIFKKIDPQIPVHSTTSIKKLILECDVMINITPEDNQPSTVLLEGLILRKPVIDISLDDRKTDFEYDKNLPIIFLSYKSNVIQYIEKIFNDFDFKRELDAQIDFHLKNYLSNHKNASSELADYLRSF